MNSDATILNEVSDETPSAGSIDNAPGKDGYIEIIIFC